MKLLLDEMHAPGIAAELRERGHDVLAVAADATLRGVADEALLAHAHTADRALVTENVRDFLPIAARWDAESRPHSGLVLTGPRRFNRATVAYPGNLLAALQHLLDEPPVTGHSWLWWL